MLRDVGVYCLAIFSVLLAFMLGQVRQGMHARHKGKSQHSGVCRVGGWCTVDAKRHTVTMPAVVCL